LRDRFRKPDPFTYVRFGDADLYFIDDPSFKLNRRHDPSPNLTRGLRKSFAITHDDYLIGSVAGTTLFEGAQDKLKEIASSFDQERDYYSPIAFHHLYTSERQFTAFVKEAFHGKKILLIGGEAICRSYLVRAVFDLSKTIEFTDRNAFYQIDDKMKDIGAQIPKHDVVISALGQGARVLAGRLWKKRVRTQYFDVGSVVDALADRPLRTWIEHHAHLSDTYKEIFL
jgi:hypothetical protein